MYTVTRTASTSAAPAAEQTASRFSRQRRACSAGVVPTSSPLSGSSGICPEQNSSPPWLTAWLYGPMAAGAPSAVTAWRWSDTNVLLGSDGLAGHPTPARRYGEQRLCASHDF